MLLVLTMQEPSFLTEVIVFPVPSNHLRSATETYYRRSAPTSSSLIARSLKPHYI